MLVVIGIPSFRRPAGLSRLLQSLALQQTAERIHIVIADNDADRREGLAVAQSFATANYPFPITGKLVPKRGISEARNALLDEAFAVRQADVLCMLDDDVRVESDWLQHMLDMQRETGADVIGGRVLPEFEHGRPKWSIGQTIYEHTPAQVGMTYLIDATTNVAIARKAFDDGCLQYFDAAYSTSGGGDKHYFMRLKQRGATFAFAGNAICYEHYGSSRATKRWAIQRAFRIGASDMRILVELQGTMRRRVVEVARAFTGLLVGPLAACATLSSSTAHMKYVLMSARQLGKMSALLHRYGTEYSRTHGD